MDKLKLMKTFMVIVQEGNIARAANILGLTKAAASKQLIDLETHFSTQLFRRTTRRLKITETGRLFYESLNEVFAAVNHAESIVTRTTEKPIGTLRITSHRNFGEKYIVNNLKEFIDIYPDIKIDLELADRFPDMEKENIDILCGASHEGPEHLIRKKISAAYPILCASPDYLAKFGVPKKPDDLKSHRYITHSFRNPDNIICFNNNRVIYKDFHIRLNDAKSMLNCALQGLGFTKIFNYFAEEYLQSGELVEILSQYREPEKSIYIFYQNQKFVPLKIRLFLDFLYEKVSPLQKNNRNHFDVMTD